MAAGAFYGALAGAIVWVAIVLAATIVSANAAALAWVFLAYYPLLIGAVVGTAIGIVAAPVLGGYVAVFGRHEAPRAVADDLKIAAVGLVGVLGLLVWAYAETKLPTAEVMIVVVIPLLIAVALATRAARWIAGQYVRSARPPFDT